VSPQAPWYEEFFTQDYRAFWHSWPDDPERCSREMDGVMALLELEPGDAVLDLCCGQGRHSVELAKRGLKVTGLDLSESLLDEARQAAVDAGVEVRFVRRDMRDIPFSAEFDAVICMFTAFGYLETDEEDQKVICAAAGALKPGGALLLDLANHDANHRAGLRDGCREWREAKGGYALIEHRMCLHPRAWHVDVICLDKATERRYTLKIRAYTADEAERMMHAAGLSGVGVCGGLDGRELTAEASRLIVTARKPQGQDVGGTRDGTRGL